MYNRTIRAVLVFGMFQWTGSIAQGELPRREKLNTGKEHGVGQLAFSPDGKMLAVACGKVEGPMEIQLFSMQTRRRVGKLRGHDQPVGSLRFTPDSKMLVSDGADEQCLIWDVGMRELVGRLKGHTGRILGLSISLDSKHVATAGDDKSIIIWDLQLRKQVAHLTGHTDAVTSVEFLPDGVKLVSAGRDKTVKVWDWKAKKELFSFKANKLGVASNVLAVTPDGRRIVTGGDDGHIVLWELYWNPARINDLARWSLGRDKPISIAMKPDGKQIAVGTWGGMVDLISLSEEAVVAELRINAHNFPANAVAFDKDGKLLASGSALESGVSLWLGLP